MGADFMADQRFDAVARTNIVEGDMQIARRCEDVGARRGFLHHFEIEARIFRAVAVHRLACGCHEGLRIDALGGWPVADRYLFKHFLGYRQQGRIDIAEQVDRCHGEAVAAAQADQFDLPVEFALLFDQQRLDIEIAKLSHREVEQLGAQRPEIVGDRRVFQFGQHLVPAVAKTFGDRVEVCRREIGQPVDPAVDPCQRPVRFAGRCGKFDAIAHRLSLASSVRATPSACISPVRRSCAAPMSSVPVHSSMNIFLYSRVMTQVRLP